ncbi:hypothetical protein CPT_Sansa76 [Caulobacter phage Sansa]|uniref:Uncharacterized protein n=1 Tax=Caulobacter phage Sansa TaxID=1675600 RepID=A0A0K1LMY2_9CAUD|nr:hypothetical protein HOR07_gp076 [Caulobacter phage Sansa]AKU43480.1 hypothetical protein CPT_Sansa76 [Caulobacter phage Sansa]
MSLPNSQSPDGDSYLKHLAIALRDNAELDRVKAKRKANRERAKKAGVDLKDMDQDIKMSSWSPSEVAQYFARKITYLAYRGVQIGKQFDLFSGINPTVNSSTDFYPSGMFAAMNNLPPRPPSNLSQNDSQRWMEGWNAGNVFASQAAEEEELAAAAVRAMQNDGEGGDDDEDRDDTDGGNEGAGGQLAADEEAETLFLVLGDFANAESLDDCTIENYSGPPADLDAADKIIVEHDGESKVLKGGDEAPAPVAEAEPPQEASPENPAVLSKGGAEEFVETPVEELRQQAGRKTSTALSQSAKAESIRAEVEKSIKPKKPRTAKSKDTGPL